MLLPPVSSPLLSSHLISSPSRLTGCPRKVSWEQMASNSGFGHGRTRKANAIVEKCQLVIKGLSIFRGVLLAFVAELTVRLNMCRRTDGRTDGRGEGAHKVGLNAIERCGLSKWCCARANSTRENRSREKHVLPPPLAVSAAAAAHVFCPLQKRKRDREGGREGGDRRPGRCGGDICILFAQCALMRRHSGGGGVGRKEGIIEG